MDKGDSIVEESREDKEDEVNVESLDSSSEEEMVNKDWANSKVYQVVKETQDLPPQGRVQKIKALSKLLSTQESQIYSLNRNAYTR